MSTTIELDIDEDGQPWWPAICDAAGKPVDTESIGLDVEVDVERAQKQTHWEPGFPADASCTGEVWVWRAGQKPVRLPPGPLLDAVLDAVHEQAEEKALEEHYDAQDQWEDRCDDDR